MLFINKTFFDEVSDPILNICGGTTDSREDYLVIQTESNKVYIYGEFLNQKYDKPCEICQNLNILGIACSKNVIFIQTVDKEVYSFGMNEFGESGTGLKEKYNRNQEKITTPTKIPLKEVEEIYSSQYSRTIFVKTSDDIYFFGQIMGNIISSPEKLTSFKINEVKKIEVGFGHILLLTNKGEVYVKGFNTTGQCFFETTKTLDEFTKIQKYDSKVKDIYCGESHSGLILNNEIIVLFGKNWSYQLGLQSEDKHFNELTDFCLKSNIKLLLTDISSYFIMENEISYFGSRSKGITLDPDFETIKVTQKKIAKEIQIIKEDVIKEMRIKLKNYEKKLKNEMEIELKKREEEIKEQMKLEFKKREEELKHKVRKEFEEELKRIKEMEEKKVEEDINKYLKKF